MLARFFLAFACTAAVAIPVLAQQLPRPSIPSPPPAALVRIESPPYNLELYFEELPQGGVGLLRVTGGAIRTLTLHCFQREIPTFVSDDAHYALLAVAMQQAPRQYTLRVAIVGADGAVATIEANFPVTVGRFITREVTLPRESAALLDDELEQAEVNRLREWVGPETQASWENLQWPTGRPLSAPYGEFRSFNGDYRARHSGWDFRAPLGSPVAAMAAGRVVYAGWLALRGHYVLIDHGATLYSGYAHFSQVHVVRGQRVRAGQIIGMSGTSGRSTAPHLHWEVALQGQWVDGRAVMEMWLPWPQALTPQ